MYVKYNFSAKLVCKIFFTTLKMNVAACNHKRRG